MSSSGAKRKRGQVRRMRAQIAIPCHTCSWGKVPCKATGEAHKIEDWSGWPGAYCQHCHITDPQELCLADGCECQCHPVPPMGSEGEGQ